jgi:hypothetical protein
LSRSEWDIDSKRPRGYEVSVGKRRAKGHGAHPSTLSIIGLQLESVNVEKLSFCIIVFHGFLDRRESRPTPSIAKHASRLLHLSRNDITYFMKDGCISSWQIYTVPAFLPSTTTVPSVCTYTVTVLLILIDFFVRARHYCMHCGPSFPRTFHPVLGESKDVTDLVTGQAEMEVIGRTRS